MTKFFFCIMVAAIYWTNANMHMSENKSSMQHCWKCGQKKDGNHWVFHTTTPNNSSVIHRATAVEVRRKIARP